MGFKKARERSGLTQQEAAIRIGVDQSTVCLWEIGKTKPRANLLPKIASIYGCSVDELLAEEKVAEMTGLYVDIPSAVEN